ncbi:MAG: response regulator [Anaerolineales bacterium]|nr:response regulator [Anaerolineales bacterium]
MTGTVVVVRDITERKRAEEARAKLEEELRQTQKMESIGRLAGGVAHDFNNLLTVIRGYSEFMQKRMQPDDPHLEDLEQIRHASERAASLTRQLLAFSRKQILAPTILDLNILITNLHKMLGRLIGEDITLSLNLQPELWPITADPGQMEQVIMNLVVNARDAMPTGGRLTIETGNIHLDESYTQTHPTAPPGPCVLLAVTDTGYGMDKSTLTRIFEPFFTTKEPGQGTGLGLATVFGIVKQSGGDILVYSEPNQGATFKVFLPANKTQANPAFKPPVQLTRAKGHETILLVEDEEQVRSLVRNILQDQGYKVLETHLGSEALLVAQHHQHSIDLLITDVIMPQMSGRVLAEQLKKLLPDLKVLFMSGYTDDTVVRHGLLTAEVEFLSKPFSPIALLTKLREVLDK